MKKYFFSILVILGIPESIYSDKLPSVADVFGSMSEDEITKQVQMGQQFLADLEKYGTPEEKAEFEKILLDTLNSMSEQDFQDIQNIAKMVEPNLAPIDQQPQITPAIQPPVKEEIIPKASEQDSEKFKNLIMSIIARIDEILQKIESSKECKEELDAHWSNRATLSSMKRQIAQLKNSKLAEKLSKQDLSEDDKALVTALENFLKELTEKNNKLVIEDTFGLSDSKELDKKYLRQTQDILAMFDAFIESLMPKLEKFLSKWDPEALALAKESAAQTAKALQQSQDALKRNPSADARAAQQDRSSNQQRSYYNDYDAYPDYYNQYGYPYDDYNNNYAASNSTNSNGQQASDKEGTKSSSSANSSSSGNSTVQKDEKDKDKDKAKPKEAKKNTKDKNQAKSSSFDDIMDSIESHISAYSDQMASKHLNFLNHVVTDGYKDLTPALEKSVLTWGKNSDGYDAHGAKPNNEGISDWLFKSFVPYTQSVSKLLETDYQSFTDELDSAKRLCAKVESSAKDLSADEMKKVSEEINALAARFNVYHTTYRSTIKTIETSFDKNFGLVTDKVIVGDEIQNSSDKPMYVKQVQNQFVAKLKADLGDRISTALADIKNLQSNIERKAKRKSKSSKSSSVIMENKNSSNKDNKNDDNANEEDSL